MSAGRGRRRRRVEIEPAADDARGRRTADRGRRSTRTLLPWSFGRATVEERRRTKTTTTTEKKTQKKKRKKKPEKTPYVCGKRKTTVAREGRAKGEQINTGRRGDPHLSPGPRAQSPRPTSAAVKNVLFRRHRATHDGPDKNRLRRGRNYYYYYFLPSTRACKYWI